MISAILNTNVIVQSAISSTRSASARVLDAYYDGRFQLIYSSETLNELMDVLLLPDIRDLHGMSDDEVLDFVASVLTRARHAAPGKVISPPLHEMSRTRNSWPSRQRRKPTTW